MKFKAQLIRTGTSERTEVFVSIERKVLRLSNGDSYPIGEVSVGERSGVNSPFFIFLPSGQQLIITENVREFADEFYKHLPFYRKNWLHRFETWGKSLLVSVLVLIAAITFWLTKGSDMAAEWLANRISYDLEYELGKHILSGLSTLGWTVRKPSTSDEKRVEELFYFLSEQAEVKYAHFYVLDKPKIVNAFAIPGGFVVFTSEMIDDYISEEDGLEALGGVAAHELGHIKHRHSLRILIKSALVASIFTILTGDVSIVSLGMAQQLLSLAYTRKQEEEADAYAITLLMKSYLDPEPFIELMQNLKEKYDTDEVPEFLQSHPHMSKRIKKMRQLMEQLKKQDFQE